MIYAMQPIGGGPVKLGYSTNVEVRRRQLEKHYGQPLVVLAVMEGDEDAERAVHERFSHLRYPNRLGWGRKTEQFRPTAELMTFIGRPLLADPNPDSVEVMPSVAARRSAHPSLPVDLIEKASWLAAARGEDLSDYLSDLLRPIIERQFRKAGKELMGGDE